MFSHSIVAGTFDHLHLGHQKLLQTAFQNSRQVSIGLTQPNLTSNKTLSGLIEPRPTRQKTLKKSLIHCSNFNIFPLNSPLEPATTSTIFDAIITSTDTFPAIKKINQLRLQHNLKPLKSVVVDLQKSSDKKPISSTRIRQGQLNRQGFAYHQVFPKNKKLTLPSIHRQSLKKPFGQFLSGSLNNLNWAGLKARQILIKNPPTLTISVGDIATITLLKQQFNPSLAIIDLKTNRQPIFNNLSQLGLSSTPNHFVANPPSSITPNLVSAIQTSITQHNQVIQVNGEEDLSVLPAILLSPLNTAIFYGQPNKGLVYIKVTESIKQKTLNFLQKLTY